MRLHAPFLLSFLALCTTKCVAQDENSEDVFDKPLAKDENPSVGTAPDFSLPQEEMMNEGSDSFETSTEMIEMSGNETSLEVNPVQKTAVFSPVTPIEGPVFNFSKATIEEDSMEDEDDSSEKSTTATTTMLPPTTQKLDVITFSSLPIEQVDEVADRRVLKEKELPTPVRTVTTTQPTVSVSDPSESEDEGETPFDQSALEGLFEQDGSVIDSALSTDSAPAFPILKMKEEDSKILTMSSTTTERTSTTVRMTTAEEVTTTTATSTTESSHSPTTATTTSEATTTTSEEATTSSEETTTEEIVSIPPALKNSSKVFLPAKAIRTPIAFRIVSLDFSADFNDIHSGPSKKLSREIVPSIGEFINSIAGEDNLVSVEIKSFTKGSVIVSADVLTKKSLGDAQLAVNLLEAAFSRNNSMLSDYQVDSLSVTVDGMTSQAYIDSISTQTSSSYSLSSLMIVIVTFALVIVFGVALFIIMITTKRRRQSTMKLSLDDTIRSITPESDDTPRNVHLMSYGTTPRASQKPGPITKTQIDETSSPMY